jgi:hypothetical protein
MEEIAQALLFFSLANGPEALENKRLISQLMHVNAK